MSVPLQPMAEYVVVQTEAAATKTASGLYLPESATEKPKIANVVAIGSDVKNVKVGEKVIYKNEYDATTVKIDSKEYILVDVKNIIATTK
jgi:chaperonin GroES